jgi:molybdopterin/thiamine biosynthesis adenylyltransferase
LGIGGFTIADPDVFDVPNFNRQYGANLTTLGRNKAETMAEMALDVNPKLKIRVLPAPITQGNMNEFLDGADVFVDGVDFFAIHPRRLLFRRAAELGIWAVTSGPVGFSAAWLSFDPNGMAFDDYFDLRDDMGLVDQLCSFAVGLTPKATHLAYLDLSAVDIASGAAPSTGLACQLATGVLAAEVLRIRTNPTAVRAAPHFSQFDPWRLKLRTGRLRRGNRSAWQRLKRRLLKRQLKRRGIY